MSANSSTKSHFKCNNFMFQVNIWAVAHDIIKNRNWFVLKSDWKSSSNVVGLNQNCVNLSQDFEYIIFWNSKQPMNSSPSNKSTGKQTTEKLAALQQKLNDWLFFFFKTIFNFWNNDFFNFVLRRKIDGKICRPT